MQWVEETPNGHYNPSAYSPLCVCVCVCVCVCIAGEDYVNRPINFNIKNETLSQACFNISIINDDRYETEETFQINFTTTPPLPITPTHLTIIIMDEDSKKEMQPHFLLLFVSLGLEVAWETMVYTVQEGDEEVELCVQWIGMYAGTLPGPELTIELMENTAQQDRGEAGKKKGICLCI